MKSFVVHNIRQLAVVTGLVASLAASHTAAGQRSDSARVLEPIRPLSSIPLDSLNPPISPRRAFFYSFLVPGSGQSVLGRHKAAATFLFIEAICIAMIRESGADVHEARRTANDTLIVSYVDGSGNPAVTTAPPRYGSAEIHTREAHVEDWAALLVGNHLFAGADAFVSAHLWDVPVHLGLRATPGGHVLVVGASLTR